MANSVNQIREIFVADVLATETTLKAFQATASDGELGIFMSDGSNGDTAGDFVVATKIAGKVITSDVYKAEEVKKAVALTYKAPVLRSITVTPTVLTAGTEYVLNLRIQNFGSLSPENFYIKHAQYIVKAGDTATNVCDGLRASLNKNFSKESGATLTSNPYFTFGGTDTLVITEKDQPLDLGRDEGRPLVFDVTVDTLVDGTAIATIAVTAGGSPGVGTGKSVAIMEDFYRTFRGDAYGLQHFPYNWGVKTKRQADPAGTYALVEILAVKKQDEEINVVGARKELTIAVPVAAGAGGVTNVNAIIDKIELVTGKTIAALSEF